MRSGRRDLEKGKRKNGIIRMKSKEENQKKKIERRKSKEENIKEEKW